MCIIVWYPIAKCKSFAVLSSFNTDLASEVSKYTCLDRIFARSLSGNELVVKIMDVAILQTNKLPIDYAFYFLCLLMIKFAIAPSSLNWSGRAPLELSFWSNLPKQWGLGVNSQREIKSLDLSINGLESSLGDDSGMGD